jgi:tetratricopeptide (TPR) repeat protein
VIESYEAIVAAADADPERMQRYAEFLLSGDPEDVRNPGRALALAERAVALTRRRAYLCLQVLGTALERTGQPQAAIAALRDALAVKASPRLRTRPDPLPVETSSRPLKQVEALNQNLARYETTKTEAL